MDIFLTNLTSGERLRLPLLPDRINVRTSASVVSLSVIKTGEVRIPRGTTLTGYSWSGLFPGQRMQALSFVFDWQPPTRIVALLTAWQNSGQTLRLMVTDLSINTDVFIESFSYEHHGVDDISYTLNLSVRRQLTITTVPARPAPPKTATSSAATTADANKRYGTVRLNNPKSFMNVRQKASSSSKIIGRLNHGERIEILGKEGNWYKIPHKAGINGVGYAYASYIRLDAQTAGKGGSGGFTGAPGNTGGGTDGGVTTHKVRAGESLYSIAKALLGDGSRWLEIYQMNKAAIDAANKGKGVSQYTITAGMSLRLPAKKPNTAADSSIYAKAAKNIVSAVSSAVTAVKSFVTQKPSAIAVQVADFASKAFSMLKKAAPKNPPLPKVPAKPPTTKKGGGGPGGMNEQLLK